MFPHPNNLPFELNVNNPPHCFMVDQHKEDTFYRDQVIRGDIRRYYRLVRTVPNISHTITVGYHGITCGELAIAVLRNRHGRRK